MLSDMTNTRIVGRRSTGRKKMSCIRNIRQSTGLKFEDKIRTAHRGYNREAFATVISKLG